MKEAIKNPKTISKYGWYNKTLISENEFTDTKFETFVFRWKW